MKIIQGHAQLVDFSQCSDFFLDYRVSAVNFPKCFVDKESLTQKYPDINLPETSLPKIAPGVVYYRIPEASDWNVDFTGDSIKKTITVDDVTTKVDTGLIQKIFNLGTDEFPYVVKSDVTMLSQHVFNPYTEKTINEIIAEKYTNGFQYSNVYSQRNILYPEPYTTQFEYMKKRFQEGSEPTPEDLFKNGVMHTLKDITEEDTKILDSYPFYYMTSRDVVSPIYGTNDTFVDTTTSYNGVTYEVRAWNHIPDRKVYFGVEYGKGVYFTYNYGGYKSTAKALTVTLPTAFYDEDGSLLGNCSQLLSGASVDGDGDYSVISYMNVNGDNGTYPAAYFTTYTFGLDMSNGEINDIRFLSYNSRSSTETVLLYGSLNGEYQRDILFNDSGEKMVYGTLKYWFMKAIAKGFAPDPDKPSVDPYNPAGPSDIGGGNGSWDYTSDPIDIPQHPGQFAIDSGFLTTYVPTKQQIGLLADFLLSNKEIDGQLVNLFFNAASVVVKQFANPMDVITSFSVMPFTIPKTSELYEVKVGFVGTGLSFPKPLNQYVEVDCGTLRIEPITGSYLDYDSQIDLFLPYIGNVPIRPDDVFGKDVRIVYHIDIITGALACYIKVNDSVLYNYNGQCGQQIPLTANDYSNLLNAVVSAGTAIVGPVAAASGSALQASAAGFNAKDALSLGVMEGASQLSSMGNALQSSLGVSSIKPNIQKSGSISGPGGMLNIQKPYFTITTPNVCLPEGQKMYQGYPLMATRKLGDLKGFTTIHEIHLENIGCTMEEMNEINALLKGGVIL